MYLSLLSLVVAILVGVASWYGGAGWLGGSLLGFAAFVVTWIIGVRRIGRRIGPLFEQAQRQIQAGTLQPAIATLKNLLPIGKWIPLLTGQIHAQLGYLHHQAGKREEAIEHLSKAGRRAGDARLLLASLETQDGKKAEALKLLADSLPFNRKHVLLHNTYAWLLLREGKRDEAIAVLTKLLLKESDANTTDNRLRLQNDKRMNMAPFGMMWYALGFERPPASMGQMRTGQKGFRQAPKRGR